MKSEQPNRNKEDRELRLNIANFIFGSEDEVKSEILSMESENLNEFLAEVGVDLQPRMDEFHVRLSAALGQGRLDAARRARLQASEHRADKQPHKVDKYIGLGLEALRSLAEQRFTRTGTQAASAYGRHMQNATEESLREMLNDLDRLEE